MKKQTPKKNIGSQEPWVDFFTHKCDQDPLRELAETVMLINKKADFIEESTHTHIESLVKN